MDAVAFELARGDFLTWKSEREESKESEESEGSEERASERERVMRP